MCDICAIRCTETGCSIHIPVHIADFCCPREMVEVRCALHPPTQPGWTAFDLCADELHADEEDLREPEYATVYMRFVGDPAVLRAAEASNAATLTRLGYPSQSNPVYGVGDIAGQPNGICPNGPWYQRESGADHA